MRTQLMNAHGSNKLYQNFIKIPKEAPRELKTAQLYFNPWQMPRANTLGMYFWEPETV